MVPFEHADVGAFEQPRSLSSCSPPVTGYADHVKLQYGVAQLVRPPRIPQPDVVVNERDDVLEDVRVQKSAVVDGGKPCGVAERDRVPDGWIVSPTREALSKR
jgi:hypothetical protein